MTALHTPSAVFILFFVVGVHCGSFDVVELEDTKYLIDIDSFPAGFPSDKELSVIDPNNEERLRKDFADRLPNPLDTSYVFLTSKSGQKFACRLPEIPKKEDAPIPDSLNPKYVAEIVSAGFYVKNCITKNTGWWTYELCRGKQITQHHSQKGKSDFAEYSLGLYTGLLDMPEYVQSTRERMLYLEEQYRGGSMCDVLGKQVPRRTAVRYECDPVLSTSEAYILSVSEEASCEYLVTVRMGSLCKLPQFVVPSDLMDPLLIGCHPYVEKEKAIEHARKLYGREQRKKEGKRLMMERMNAIHSINRRRSAFKRTQLKKEPRRNLKLRSRIEAEHASATEQYLKMMHLAKEGEHPTAEKIAALQMIGKYTDDFDSYLSDYETLEDMDRGNFYFYMKDRHWPKDEFPKSSYYADVLNGYFEEAERKALRSLSDKHAEEIREKAKKNPWVAENNVLIGESKILSQLDEYYPSWYARDGPDDGEYADLIHQEIYQNEVVDAFIVSLFDEFKEGVELANDRKSLLYQICRNLAPLIASLKITQDGDAFPLILRSAVNLVEKLVIATEYAQMTYEVRQPQHTFSFKGRFSEEEKALAVSGYWNEHYNRVVKKMDMEKRLRQREEYEKSILELADQVKSAAFFDEWDKMAEELALKSREKLDKRNPIAELLGGRSARVAVPFAMENQEELLELISKAGLGDVDMKIQIVNVDNGSGDLEQSEELKALMNDIMDEAMDTLKNKQKAERRERNYWKRVDDEL